MLLSYSPPLSPVFVLCPAHFGFGAGVTKCDMSCKAQPFLTGALENIAWYMLREGHNLKVR